MLTNPDCGNADSLFYGIVWEFPHFLFLFFGESEFPKKFWEYVFPESGFVSIEGIHIFMGQTAVLWLFWHICMSASITPGFDFKHMAHYSIYNTLCDCFDSAPARHGMRQAWELMRKILSKMLAATVWNRLFWPKHVSVSKLLGLTYKCIKGDLNIWLFSIIHQNIIEIGSQGAEK